MTKKSNQIGILIAVVVGIILLSKGGFLASTVQTCQDTEPATLSNLSSSLQGETSDSGTLSVYMAINETTQFPKHTSTSSELGVVDVIVPTGSSCTALINAIKIKADSLNETHSNINLEGKLVLDYNQSFYWCNKQSTLLFKSEDILSVSKYVNEFRVCFTTTGPDYIVDSNQCLNISGIIKSDGFCYCTNSTTKLEQGKTCIVPATNSSGSTYNPPRAIECYTDSGCTKKGVTRNDCSLFWEQKNITISGKCNINQKCEYGPEPMLAPCSKNELWLQQNIYYLIIAALILSSLAYYMYERGPERGFFRGKKSEK